MIAGFARRLVVVVSVAFGLILGAALGLFIALVREPPSAALVDELLNDPVVQASIEDEIIEAIDDEVELPLVDDQLDVVVETAVRLDSGRELVSDVARAVVAREFENGPDTIDVQLGSFIGDLPGPLQLVAGLLDREVTIDLPTASSPPASERLTLIAVLSTAGAVAWALLGGLLLSRSRRSGLAARNFSALLFAAAFSCAVSPLVVAFAWSQSSDLGQRLLQRQLVDSQNRIWMLALSLAVAGLGAAAAAWFVRQKQATTAAPLAV